MDISKTAFGVVGLVVAVLIVATVAIPLADDLQVTSPVELENESYSERYSEVASITVSSVESAVTVGGEVFETPANGTALILSDKFVLVYNDGYYWRGVEGSASVASTDALGAAWSFTLSSGTWTFNDGTDTYQGTVGVLFVIDDDGRFCLTDPTMVAYADRGAPTYLVNAAVSSGNGAYFAFGTVDDVTTGTDTGILVNHLGNSSGAMTWTANPVDGAYAITAGAMTVGSTNLVLDTLVEVSYTAQVVSESGTYTMLIGVVITLLVIAPVMMAVRLIGGRD